MHLAQYCSFIREVNCAADTGRYRTLAREEVEAHIACGDLLPFLRQRLGRDIDLSRFDLLQERELTSRLRDLLIGSAGREREASAAEQGGLCLLIACTTELIRRQQWD